MQIVFDFIQQQLLGMQWLAVVVSKLLIAIGIDPTERVGGTLQFFIYDSVKIVLLLCILIFVISYIQSYFPPERSKKIMSRFNGFTRAKIPLGVTFSFLISSPMVDLGSLVILMSIFGIKIALAYVIVGLIIAIIGGAIIEKLNMQSQIESFITQGGSVDIENVEVTQHERLMYAREQVKLTLKKTFIYILIGVGLGAIIHNWLPTEVITTLLGSDNPFGVVLATLIGVPMYGDIFGTIPVAEALLGKGALLGTVLSLMMAVTTLSLPSLIMLRRVIKPKLLALFVVICTLGIILVGYLFNFFQYLFI